jgi:hypothetical protein
VLVSSVWANGGDSIAAAPELPNGKTVSGAKLGIDYWRATIASGDTLRIDFESVGIKDQLIVCVLGPKTTDFTANGSRCEQPEDGENYVNPGAKSEDRYVFSQPGRYTVAIGPWIYCFSAYLNQTCDDPNGYELTAYIVHRTAIRLQSTPRLLRTGAQFRVGGRVQGVNRGALALQIRQGGWRNVRVAKIAANGSFTANARAPKTAGVYRYRIMYPGDATHRGSNASFKITVG